MKNISKFQIALWPNRSIENVVTESKVSELRAHYHTYIHTYNVIVPSIHKIDLLCITEVQIRTIN